MFFQFAYRDKMQIKTSSDWMKELFPLSAQPQFLFLSFPSTAFLLKSPTSKKKKLFVSNTFKEAACFFSVCCDMLVWSEPFCTRVGRHMS